MFERKVCKSCGKNGFFLKLNKDFLCSECANLQQNEMTMVEISNELIHGNFTKIESLIQEQDKKQRREEQNFNYVFKNYNTAYSLEKQGNADKALDIYIEMLEYNPPGMNYYIRPCIILERKHEYTAAIQICDLAIKRINQGYFDGNLDDFEHRRQRLLKKLEKENNNKNI